MTSKTVQTTAGPVELEVPRDRNGTFEPVTVPKGVRRLTDSGGMIMSLFGRGMTTRDIAEHLQGTYGASVSHETIANITDVVNEVVKEWRARPLDEVYPIMHIDAIRLRIRDGGAVRMKACHIAIGVDIDGIKQVLGMWIEQADGARFWAGVLAERVTGSMTRIRASAQSTSTREPMNRVGTEYRAEPNRMHDSRSTVRSTSAGPIRRPRLGGNRHDLRMDRCVDLGAPRDRGSIRRLERDRAVAEGRERDPPLRSAFA